MRLHYHAGLDHLIVTGVMAVIFIDVMGIVAANLTKQPGAIGKFGSALGAAIPWKG